MRGDVTRKHVITCGCDAQQTQESHSFYGGYFEDLQHGGWCLVGSVLVCPAHTVIVKDEPSPGEWTAVRHEAG